MVIRKISLQLRKVKGKILHRLNIMSRREKTLFIMVALSAVTILVIGGKPLLIHLFSRAEGTGQYTVQVSKDGITYTDSISLMPGQGYYIRVAPSYDGYLEARSPKPEDPSGYKIFKWDETVGGAKIAGGVGHISGQQLDHFARGVYEGEFRPYLESGVNMAGWSNKISVHLLSQGNAQQTKQIKVFSFNVLKGYEAFCGGDEQRAQLDRTVDYITENNYDIVFLQESECTDVFAKAWQDKLRQASPSATVYFARVQNMQALDKQISIFSRFPLLNPPAISNNPDGPVEVTGDIFKYFEAEHRRVLNVVADISGMHIRLIGIHPSPSGCNQIQTDIQGYVSQFTDMPIIMAGDYNCSTRFINGSATFWVKKDFNITCLSDTYRTDRNCGSSIKKEGVFSEWKEDDMGPIDHIATSKNTMGGVTISAPTNNKIIRSQDLKYSDHNPVSAEYTITGNVFSSEGGGLAEDSLCISWEHIMINNCTYEDYFASPRKSSCIISSPQATLHLKAPWATKFKWSYVPRSLFCADQNDASWTEEPYVSEKTLSMGSGYGEYKICTSFADGSKKTKPCGAIIEYKDLTPTPTIASGRLSVVSYNMEAASKTKDITPSLNSVEASMQEGHRWDLVGLQELAEFPQENISRATQFRNYFQQKGITYYCETQRQYHWLFRSTLCSRYPIVAGSYREYPIYIYSGGQDPATGQKSARVIQCVLTSAPVGELIFCNLHTKADTMGEQRGKIKDILTKTVPADYSNMFHTPEQNLARMVITGDFNSVPSEYVDGLVQACDPDRTKCSNPYYIDHVTYFSASGSIKAISAFRDTSKSWQTDHLGPVIADLQVSLP